MPLKSLPSEYTHPGFQRRVPYRGTAFLFCSPVVCKADNTRLQPSFAVLGVLFETDVIRQPVEKVLFRFSHFRQHNHTGNEIFAAHLGDFGESITSTAKELESATLVMVLETWRLRRRVESAELWQTRVPFAAWR